MKEEWLGTLALVFRVGRQNGGRAIIVAFAAELVKIGPGNLSPVAHEMDEFGGWNQPGQLGNEPGQLV